MTTWTLTKDGLFGNAVDNMGKQITCTISAIPPEDTILPYVPTQAEIVAQLESAIQNYIDSKAQAKGYDSANSCISYLNSSIPTWKADAVAMNTWRDSVWKAAYTDQTSATPSTTWTQVQAILPVAPW